MRTVLFAIALSGLIGTPLYSQTSAPVYQILQAENYSAKQGGLFVQTVGNWARDVHNLGNGNWLQFDNVSFIDGQYDTVTLF
jgi:hypothetical protein